jgi:lipopolysaccharide export LptBFGC system permease protein LptF
MAVDRTRGEAGALDVFHGVVVSAVVLLLVAADHVGHSSGGWPRLAMAVLILAGLALASYLLAWKETR